jgi:epoxide hydrolase 4
MVPATLEETPLTHRYVDLGDVRLHYVEAGSGPLVVLLHGFPDFWYSWRHQIPALVQAGFHVVAPDMRGYHRSSKPPGVQAYRADLLTRDVERLIREVGAAKAVVVGHDWGAAVAWSFAMRYPALVERLVIMNVPHPARMLRALRTARQLRKSWYMFFFQLPRLPEALLRANDFATLRRLFRTDPVRRGAFSEADIERYVEAARQPGALTGGINYYRALFRQGFGRARASIRPIEAPVLVIWGEQDRYLGAELAEPDPALVPHARVERLPDASHWVHLDRPERVNALLLDFLADLRRRAPEDVSHHSGG